MRNVVFVGLVLFLIGCSSKDDNDIRISEPQDLIGQKCAVVVGSMMGDLTQKVQPGIGIEWFNDFNSGVEAVRLGKVAAMPLDRFYARRWAQQDPNSFAITKQYHAIPWAFFFAKGSPLRAKVDVLLSKMRATGDLDRIITKWGEAENLDEPQFDALDYRPDFTGRAGTLRFAIPGDREPVDYTRADGIVGFDIDIVRRIAYELDMTLELVRITMNGLVPAVQSGKVDMGGGGIAITATRAQTVDFSDSYFQVPVVFLIRRSSACEAEIRSLVDLKGRTCAAILGTALQEIVERVQSGIKFETFNDCPSAIEAIRLGKVDVMPIDTVVGRRWVKERPNDIRILLTFANNPYGYVLQKGSPLVGKVNAVLRKLKKSGEIDRIINKWCDAPDLGTVEFEPPRRKSGGAAGRLRFVTSGDFEPGAFFRNGELVGFDIDILRRIAEELDMQLEIVNVAMTALVPAVQNGKADIGGGGITITEERKVKVDFTDCYLDCGFALIGHVAKSAGAPTGRIRTAADLKGSHVAHMSSDFHRKELAALQPDIVFEPYSEYAFAFESLRNGKIDAISIGKTYADIWQAKFPGEFRVAFDYAGDVCCFLLPKNSPLKPKLDAELRRMNAAGETAMIIRKWTNDAKEGRVSELPRATAPANAPKIRIACAAQAEPWCFVANGVVTGSDIEILTLVANRLGVRLVPKIFSWGGMVDCVNAGRCEIANGGIYTAGNTFPTVDVSEKYADERMCILVRNDDSGANKSGIVEFVKSLKESYVRTFVTENRWRMLAKGFGVTLLITLLSVVFGTLLAFPVWLARTSRVGFVSACAKAYIAVLQGTPVLVLLMILFYIVFGKVDIDGIWVAVIGFGLNLSAYVGEMLRSGVDSVSFGQTEAALSLGYTPRQAFFRFVLPQATKAILPVYRGELIGLLKMTSIVGYIAIGDLTKASDLVRSRTYESFFPIITTAFIYFVASWVLALALEWFGRRLDLAGRIR